MMKEVLLKVKGTQRQDSGSPDTIELITPGKMFIKNEMFYITYSETEISGMEGTTTLLKVEPEKVTLNRMGNSEQKHTFEKGVLNDGYYITPYGTMQMSVIPSKVEVDLTANGGSINLEYELQVNQKKLSDNHLSITVSDLN